MREVKAKSTSAEKVPEPSSHVKPLLSPNTVAVAGDNMWAATSYLRVDIMLESAVPRFDGLTERLNQDRMLSALQKTGSSDVNS